MGDKVKKRKGEKNDAYLVENIEPMQRLMTSVLGERCENEALCNFEIESAALDEYLAKKNSQNPEYKYTFFHVVCAAASRILAERPRMNYFIRNGNFYERKEISIVATAKKQKKDGAAEGLIIMKYDKNSDVSPVEQMHNSICKQVYNIRKSDDSMDDTTDFMSTLVKLPKFIYNLIVKILLSLDRHGNLPKDISEISPYSKSLFISNLGSIKMSADYHHLSNFGTNSFFAIIGVKEKKPFFKEDGSFEVKEVIPFSFTIDERIGDGVYFNNTIKVFKAYLLKPELLDLPANQAIDIKAVQEELGIR